MIKIKETEYSKEALQKIMNTKGEAFVALHEGVIISKYTETKTRTETSRAVVNRETLKQRIKREFTKEFLEEIYNKYPLTTKDFQDECIEFSNYWGATLLNGKNKGMEKWTSNDTFDTKDRFRTWFRNNNKWNNKRTPKGGEELTTFG